MPTNAELAAKLLRNAAEFFRSVGEQNGEATEKMKTNADTYDMVAEWVERDAGAEGAPGEGSGGGQSSGGDPAGGASGGEESGRGGR